MIAVSKHLIWKSLGDEVILLDTLNGNYYLLNDTGSRIWLLLNDGKSIQAIARIIASEFVTTEETATTDVNELFDSLLQSGLVVPQKKPKTD